VTQVDKLEYVLYMMGIPSEEGRNAALALYRRCPAEAERILLQVKRGVMVVVVVVVVVVMMMMMMMVIMTVVVVVVVVVMMMLLMTTTMRTTTTTMMMVMMMFQRLQAQPPLLYRAIKMNIRLFRWARALELAVQHRSHVDTVRGRVVGDDDDDREEEEGEEDRRRRRIIVKMVMVMMMMMMMMMMMVMMMMTSVAWAGSGLPAEVPGGHGQAGDRPALRPIRTAGEISDSRRMQTLRHVEPLITLSRACWTS
jgi:uncharacterized membrane protein